MASDSKKDKPKKDDFAKKRQAWLGRVTMDGTLTAPAFRLAMANSQHFSRTKPGHPSWLLQKTYAEKLGVSVRTVKRAQKDLLNRGHFTHVIYRKGDSAICFPDLENINGLPEYQLETFAAEWPEVTELSPDAPKLAPLENQGVTVLSTRGDSSVHKECQNWPTEPIDQPMKEPIENIYTLAVDSAGKNLAVEIIEPGKIDSSNGDFDEWWQAYPNKVAKAGARRKYLAILKEGKATATELLAGAEYYARRQAVVDPMGQYTKHPEVWLNKGCWPDRQPIPTGSGTRSGTDSAIDGMRSFLDPMDEIYRNVL
jgi:hypothetical protein